MEKGGSGVGRASRSWPGSLDPLSTAGADCRGPTEGQEKGGRRRLRSMKVCGDEVSPQTKNYIHPESKRAILQILAQRLNTA